MYYYYRDENKPQKQFVAEEEADLAKLPTSTEEGDTEAALGDAYQRIAFGSMALCVETGGMYVLTSDDEWTKVGGDG